MRTTGWLCAGVLGSFLLVTACGRSSSRTGDDDSGDAGASGVDDGGSAGTAGKGSGGTAAKGGAGGKGGGATGGGGTGGGGAGTSGVGATGGGPDTDHYLSMIRQTAADKLDLLFMIDNSLSMTSKQELLAQSIPVLMQRLVAPNCVDADGNPTGGVATDGFCATGSPEFKPLRNIHVGVITSSLGDHGSGDICSELQNEANVQNGGTRSDYDDLAQLLPTVRSEAELYSWLDSGFLVWDPRDPATSSEPHSSVGRRETELSPFADALAAQINAAGERGCGYESSLEAWYRFLVDPQPPVGITNDGRVAHRGPVNQVLLAQRQAFLRPDSVLAIVMLTDENDCSIVDEEGVQGWLVGYKGGVGRLDWHMPRSSSGCEDVNGNCCRPCTAAPGVGCPDNAADVSCSQGSTLSLTEDSPNLRCFRQVQRFGVDLLYPTGRYVEALRSVLVTPRFGGPQVQNPLFASSSVTPSRDPSRIILAGLVGVPWQDLARESLDGRQLDYMTALELESSRRWDVMLGDPVAGILPSDALMIESVDPRTDRDPHPIIGAPVSPPTDMSLTNPINGHEQEAAYRDELQFACIFPLSEPIPCDGTNADSCECNTEELGRNSPLCSGLSANTDGTQVYDKAYPSLRELEVLRGIGDGAVVGSICPKNVTPEGDSPSADPDYGYNPFVRALVDQIKPALAVGCLPRVLAENQDGSARIACTITEAAPPVDGSCDCAAMGRGEALPEASALALEYLTSVGVCGGLAPSCESLCYCDIPQLEGGALSQCQTDPSLTEPVGFCYVDPENGFGDDVLVQGCPTASRRILRFIGDGVPSRASVVVLDCAP